MRTVKKRLLCILSAFLVLIPGFSVTAAEATPSPLPAESGARAFSAVEPMPAADYDPTGVVLWVLLLTLLAAILVYMVINAVRVHKAEKLRRENEPLKPKLVVTLGYRRSK